MRHREYEPPAELRDAIRCIWHNRREAAASASGFEVLPDGYAEIIFYFGGSCTISRGGSLQSLPPVFMMGLLNRPVVLYPQGHFEVIGIRCFPWAVFDLLGLTSGQDEVHFFQHPIALLHPVLERQVRAGRIDAALDELTRYLLAARAQVAIDSMLARAGDAMRRAHGSLPVSQVAAAAHATVRTLERRFRQSSGHTVKDVSALMRFEQVRNRLWLQPGASLAALAQELGYTDQSHLSREFKRYGGTTPSAFARKARQGQWAAGRDIVAFVQA